MRNIDELGRAESTVERDASRLRALYEAQKRIGARRRPERRARSRSATRALALVPGATHVTVVLREDDDDAARRRSAGLRADRDARARPARARRRRPSR